MKHQSLEVQIEIDGSPLEEYAVKVENDNNYTCWIASEQGKVLSQLFPLSSQYSISMLLTMHKYQEFAIKIFNYSTEWAVSSASCLDGRDLPQRWAVRPGLSSRWCGLDQGLTMLPFKFSPLRLTDGKSVSGTSDVHL